LSNATTRRNPGSDSLAKEDFLNLLMAQVTHQDPLNPMDSQGMMDQLTSMGSLEQLVNLNQEMGKLNSTQQDIAQSNAYSFLDKDVTIKGGMARVTSGASPDLQFQLPREAASVHVFVTDEQGNPVRSMDLGQMAGGTHQIPWDARDKDGDLVGDGNFRYTVAAKSSEDETIPAELLMRGKVSGIKFVDDRPVVLMNGMPIDTRNIVEISNASQRLFADRGPRALHEELRPKEPLDSKPE
jgi:flagellar basal-body rod modification protein FlgD